MQNKRVNISMLYRLATTGLLLVLLACYVNITLFSHIHIINGVVIVHSHFYLEGHAGESDDAPHSKEELQFINAINRVVAEAQSTLVISFQNIAIEIHPLFAEFLISVVAGSLCILPLLRAPPVDTSVDTIIA